MLRHRVAIDASHLPALGAATLAAGLAWPLLPRTGTDLAACPLRTLTGVPCPFCGMTTSVVATLHADPLAAAAANPFGLLLVVGIVAVMIRRPAELSVPAAAALAVVGVSWLFQLLRVS